MNGKNKDIWDIQHLNNKYIESIFLNISKKFLERDWGLCFIYMLYIKKEEQNEM